MLLLLLVVVFVVVFVVVVDRLLTIGDDMSSMIPSIMIKHDETRFELERDEDMSTLVSHALEPFLVVNYLLQLKS